MDIVERRIHWRLFWNRHRKGKYIGIEADGLTADVRRGTSNEEDWIVFRDHHPAIIDRDAFVQVQKRLTDRKTKTTPHRDGGRFLFTGLIRCGKCGGVMVGLSRDRLRYNCSTPKHSDTCDINTVFQDELADIVLTEVRKRFIDGDTMDRLKAELIRQSTTKRQDVKALRRQLDQTSRKLEKAKRRLIEVDRDLLDIVQEEVRSLREQHEYLQAAVKAAESPQDQRQADIDAKVGEALASLTRLHQVFQKADPVLQREVMQQTVSRIEVVSERDWSTKRGFFRLQRGAIHLRVDLLNNLSNTSGWSREPQQSGSSEAPVVTNGRSLISKR